ncbi:MAG: hypothetical protein H0X72_01745 [Acidobacteria bacterium]|jgi:hypothetical protein|nr:hypothetical protein [Tatlockia sp.]MBA4121173.1 hypothetical protein [Acidobacteriota bacterium]
MAWCPHCVENRPIQRQTYDGVCSYCGWGISSQNLKVEHQEGCRGPVQSALDVCTYCNTPIFAKAATETEYKQLLDIESRIDKNKKKPGCFIVTATIGDINHPAVYDISRFRDEILKNNVLGDRFIQGYYKWSPRFADIIRKSFFLRRLCYVFVVAPTHLGVRFLLKARDTHLKKE